MPEEPDYRDTEVDPSTIELSKILTFTHHYEANVKLETYDGRKYETKGFGGNGTNTINIKINGIYYNFPLP
jgi:hypothetical protein